MNARRKRRVARVKSRYSVERVHRDRRTILIERFISDEEEISVKNIPLPPCSLKVLLRYKNKENGNRSENNDDDDVNHSPLITCPI